MECGRSSGVEHNLAKVRVVSSNLIARSRNFLRDKRKAAFGPLSSFSAPKTLLNVGRKADRHETAAGPKALLPRSGLRRYPA